MPVAASTPADEVVELVRICTVRLDERTTALRLKGDDKSLRAAAGLAEVAEGLALLKPDRLRALAAELLTRSPLALKTVVLP